MPTYEEDAREWCIANNIGWCDFHEREFTDVPGSYPMCESCGWDAIHIDKLVEESGMDWDEAMRQYAEGYRTCDHCGYCKTPGKCVWSIVCPVCGAPPGIGFGQCREGGRNVKLHRERHEQVA